MAENLTDNWNYNTPVQSFLFSFAPLWNAQERDDCILYVSSHVTPKFKCVCNTIVFIGATINY